MESIAVIGWDLKREDGWNPGRIRWAGSSRAGQHCEGSGPMQSLGAGARRVYLAVGATDLRKGFDGLYGLVRSRLEEDPMRAACRFLQRDAHR